MVSPLQPLQPLASNLNNDLERLLQEAQQRRITRNARRQALAQLDKTPDIQLQQLQRKRAADEILDSKNFTPAEKKSHMERLTSAIDYSARTVARPAMGAVLANIFRVMPGEQEGEASLRRAGALNPFALLFDRQKRDRTREALEKTDLPFGVYTAMETALDPLTYLPVGYAFKGAKAGLRATGVIQPTAKVAAVTGKAVKRESERKVRRLQDIDDRIDVSMPENNFKRWGSRISNVPIIKNLLGVINPAAAEKSYVGRQLFGYGQLLEDSEGLATVAVSSIAARRFPFTIDKDGMITNIKGEPKAWADVFTQSKAFRARLNPEQREFIDEYIDILKEARRYTLDEGIDVKMIGLKEGEDYIPRIVTGKDGLDKMRSGTIQGGALGAKRSFEKSRWYETMQEGLENKIEYLNDPVAVLAQHMRGIYRSVADNKLEKVLLKLGRTPKEGFSPELLNKVYQAEIFRTRADRFVRLLQQAAVGSTKKAMRIRPQSITAFRKAGGEFEKLANRYDDLVQENLSAIDHRKQLAGLIERAKGLAEDAKQPLKEAKAERALARRLLSEAKIGSEARIPSVPGLSGRIFPKETADEITAFFTDRGNGFAEAMANVNVVARLGLTGFDFGAGMIQGLPLLVTSPFRWAKAQGSALSALRNPESMARYIDKHRDTLEEMARHGGPINFNEFVESIQRGGVAERLLERGGKPLAPVRFTTKRAAAAFTQFGLAARVELYESMRDTALRSGRAKGLSDDKILEQLTETVGKMTGVSGKARLGIDTSRNNVERALMFAPGYLRASVGLVIDAAQGGLRGELARRSLAKLLGAGTLFYYGWATALGQEPKLDPRKSDFLTVDIAGQRVGFGSMWVSMARTVAGIYGQVERDVRDEQYTGEKIVSIDPDKSILARFTRTKASPIMGLAWDVIRGRSPMGEPVGNPIEQPLEFIGDVPRYLAPFWAQSLLPDDNPITGDENKGVLIPTELAGFRAFPTNIFSQRRTRREELAQGAFEKSWQDLNGLQKKALAADETLKMFDSQISSFQLERGDDLDKKTAEFFAKQDEYRSDYDGKIRKADELWSDGGISGYEWRQKIINAGRDKRTLFNELNGPRSNYVEVIAALSNNRETRTSAVDIAYDEYIQRVVVGVPEDDRKEISDIFGEIDFDERDARAQQIKEKYGEEIFDDVLTRLRIGRETSPLLNEWYSGLELFRSYWTIGKQMADQVGLGDQYDEYTRFRNTAQADELENMYPQLKLITRQQTKTRQEMRLQSPALEAFLLKYGYVSTQTNRTVKRNTKAEIESSIFDPLILPLRNR